jgi:hypothetical protein
MTIKLAVSHAAIAAALCCLCGTVVLAADVSNNTSDQGYFVPTITKIEAFGGALTQDWPGSSWGGQGGAIGTVVVPLNENYAIQFDGLVGGEPNSFVSGLTTHAYWADTKNGLLGFYGAGQYRGENGSEGILQLGGEGNVYINRFTVAAIAGAETNAAGTGANVTTSGYTGQDGYGFGCGIFGCGIKASNGMGSLFEMNNMRQRFFAQTRFFDHVELDYYPIDDLQLSAAHEYTGGMHSAVLGGEYLFRTGSGWAPSFYLEGSIGEQASIIAGLRIYFGDDDKSLILRHREDDPTTHLRRSLETSANLHSRRGAPVPDVIIPSCNPFACASSSSSSSFVD